MKNFSVALAVLLWLVGGCARHSYPQPLAQTTNNDLSNFSASFASARNYTPYGAGEYWISTAATGNMVGDAGKGTPDEPYDGSTQANFDSNMSKLPPNVEIHLFPGTYQTFGEKKWHVKSKQWIHGAGVDSTVLQFPPSAVSSNLVRLVIAVASPFFQQGVTVSDMTLDCNYQPGAITTLHGVSLHGSSNAIYNLKLVNTGSETSSVTNYSESFGLCIWGWPYTNAFNNVIHNCVVSNFTRNYHNNLSAFGIGYTTHALFYSNAVYQTSSNATFGFGLFGTDLVASNNLMDGCALGFHNDITRGATNLLIFNNIFTNVEAAVFSANSSNYNWMFMSNDVTLIHGEYNIEQVAGLYLYNPAAYSNVNVLFNTFRYNTNNGASSHTNIVYAYNTHTLNILTNTFEAGFTNLLIHCTNVIFEN